MHFKAYERHGLTNVFKGALLICVEKILCSGKDERKEDPKGGYCNISAKS